MKNLFKNLMLVAVAAMAFTACSQDVNEVNKIERVTRYEFTANIADDTRSGFAEKEEGATAYKSEWFGDEELKLFLSTNEGWSAEITAEINTAGQFSFELENAPESFYMTVCSPAESWSSMYSSTIPTEQTPLATSVDPKAHLLQSQATYIQTGSESISMSPQYACYGKMTVNAPADFVINKVEVSFNGGTVYTLNATHVDNNVFWFAVDSMIDVTTFTVTAYDAENNAITKTVDVAAAGKTLKFQWGRVSTFSVSGLEAPAVPEEPDTVMDSAKYYFDYNNYGGYDNWGYVVFEDEFLGTLVLNCTFASGLYLDICEYTSAANALGVRFDVGYSYYNVVGGNPSSLNYNYYNTMTVDVVDGKYSISLDVKNDNDEKLEATYVGDIEGLVYPDLRTQLAKPNVTATAEGNVINISWDPVIGADNYYVFCNVGGLESITTTETSVNIEAAYNTQYQFLIRAEANESNPEYRTSEDVYVDVTTGKDPNSFADVMATDIKWDSSNSCFSLTAPGFSYIYLEVNSANRPGNKSILVGDYTYGKNENQFRIKYNNGTIWNYGDSSGTMNVDVVDGQYIIIINVTSGWGSAFKGSIGYKGLPDGWDEPVADTTPVIKVDQSSVELKRAGGSVDVNVTLKNITDPIVAESNNAQFTTSVNGNVVTISAGENNTGADIDGIVTISAGGVSAQVTVKQVAVDAVLEVKWSYVVDSSNSGTFGHVWNVSGKDLDGYDISAQITMDSRSGYTSSSSFSSGTYSYHAFYADGNYGNGMWFTMRNIVLRGSSYSNNDVTGTITVVIEGGRTKVTADIYNYVNGYQTTKITTFVGYLN